MIKFYDTDIKFIKKFFDNAEQLLQERDVDVVLEKIDDFINLNGFDDYDYNDLGREAQKVYDNIYLNN